MEEKKIISLKDDKEKEDEFTLDFDLDLINKHFSASDNSDDGLGVWDSEIKAVSDNHLLKSLFLSEDWVFIVCDLLASEGSSAELQIVNVEVKDGKEIVTPAEDHPLQSLITHPNEWQDYNSWLYNILVEFSLMGNSIIWFNKSKGQVYVIPAEKVTMEFNKKGELEKYVLNESTEYEALNAVAEYPAEEVIHVRRPNPSSLLWGLSPFVPGRKSVLFNRYSQDYLNAFYQKGATPGMAIQMTKEANENSALRLLRSFEMAYTGRRNQRRTLILPKGTEAKTLMHSISDQQLPVMIERNMEKIINLLGVPKHSLSLAQTGSLGSEEHKQALKYLWTSRLIPILKKIAGSFNLFFAAQLGEGFRFEFNFENINVLQEDQLRKTQLAKEMKEIFTINEIRERVFDAPPLDGGDKLPGEQMPQVPFQFSLPNTEEKAFNKRDYLFKKHKAWIEESIEKADREIIKREDEINKATLDLYSNMIELVIEVLAEQKGKKGLSEDIREILERETVEVYREPWIRTHENELSKTVEAGYDQQVKLVFNKPHQDAVNALRQRDEEKRREILQQRGLNSFAQISESMTERIMKEVDKGVEDQVSITNIIGNILDTVGNPEFLEHRAERIARTEVLTAFSIGNKGAMDNTAEVIPGLVKVWITAGDDRVRDSHIDLQGDTVKHDEEFDNGLQYPRDVDSSDPSEVINCFPAETLVNYVDLERAYSRYYEGPMVTINTLGGNNLSATPNHPILTSKGWVPIGKLNVGDKVIDARFAKSSESRFSEMDVIDIPVMIKKVFDSFLKVGSTKRKSLLNSDFHGDGRQGYVDIISMDGKLAVGGETFTFQNGNEFEFSNTNLTSGKLLGFSSKNQSIGRVARPHSKVSSPSLMFSLFGSFISPLKKLCLAPISLLYSSFIKIVNYGTSGSTEHLRHLKNAKTLGKVKVDKIVGVQTKFFRGHVYNLQTKCGWYIAQNLVSHNCRCQILMVPPEDLEDLDIPEI